MFQTIAMANVSKSALRRWSLGFAKASDDIVFNARELLHVALHRARLLADAGYAAAGPAWRDGGRAQRHRHLEMMLVNMREGGMISAHDYRVAKAVATALCGGEVDTAAWSTSLAAGRRTPAIPRTAEDPGRPRQRIKHMLDTGKPLRN
jgi:3-hydroxyacyl-CoA dehydrogenase